MVSTIKAHEIMTNQYKIITTTASLGEALPLFEEDTDVLIVVDNKKRYKGILTERMILRSGLHKDTKVKKLIAPAPKITPTTPIPECARLMIENDCMHLPVFKGKELIGVVSDETLLQAVALKTFGKEKIERFMEKEVIIASPKDTIGSVLHLFRTYHISRVPVVEDGEVIGMVTLHDIVQKLLDPKDPLKYGFIIDEKHSRLDVPIENIMSIPPYTAQPQARVKEIIHMMLEYKINSVIITNKQNHLEGIVTRKDLLEPLAKKHQQKGWHIHISSKVPIPRETIPQLMNRYLRAWKEKLKESIFYYYITHHKEKKEGLQKIYIRLKVAGPQVHYHVKGEGWGIEHAVKETLLKLEKQLQSHKKALPKKERDEFMEYIDIPSLS